MSRMVVSSKPRSRNSRKAAARMRARVSSALGVLRPEVLGAGSMTPRGMDGAELQRQFVVAQQPQPSRYSAAIARQNRKSLARQRQQRRTGQPLGPVPVMFERVQAYKPGMVAQVDTAIVRHHHQFFARDARRKLGIDPGSQVGWERTNADPLRLRAQPLAQPRAKPA